MRLFQNKIILRLFSIAAIASLSQLFSGVFQEAHAATRTWDGGGSNSNWTNPTNWISDVAPVAGDDLIFPLGSANLSPFNNFAAGTVFNSITLTGTNYFLDGARIALNAGITATNTTVANIVAIPLTLHSNQSIVTGNAGVNLTLGGDIDTNGKELTFAGNGMAQVPGIISGTGGLIKAGSGTVSLYSSNTFSGAVQILQSSLSIYHGNALGSTNGNTTVAVGATLTLVNPITVPEPFVLSGNFIAAQLGKILTGPITLETNINMTITAGAGMTINSVISGPGGLAIVSSGNLTLNSNNIYTGSTTFSGGGLIVNGNQPGSAISFLSGFLSGTGAVGTIIASSNPGKSISPGTSPGILTCSNVTLNLQTTFQAELNGTALGSQYDQLNVNGTVTISNSSLFVTSTGLALSGGEQFVIIKNDGVDAINGTFGGYPEGTNVGVGSYQLKITYVGGDGNDVVIYYPVNPPAQFTAIAALTNGFKKIDGLGLSNLIYTIQAVPNLNPIITWTNLGTATANSSGIFSFTDTNAALLPMRFYRARSP